MHAESAESAQRELQTLCNLPAEDRDARLAMIRGEILPLAARRERLPDGLRFEFAYGRPLERTLDQLVAFERGCCGGLSWEATRPAEHTLRLTIRGLSPDSPLLELGETLPAPASRLGRLARSLGLGAGAALFVCCLLPMGLAAVAGASVATPLAGLDRPLIIAAVAGASAALAWFCLGRRRSPRAGRASAWY
jgi:hypothetical protein